MRLCPSDGLLNIPSEVLLYWDPSEVNKAYTVKHKSIKDIYTLYWSLSVIMLLTNQKVLIFGCQKKHFLINVLVKTDLLLSILHNLGQFNELTAFRINKTNKKKNKSRGFLTTKAI